MLKNVYLPEMIKVKKRVTSVRIMFATKKKGNIFQVNKLLLPSSSYK